MPIESLEQFLTNVRSSCEVHAERKGYLRDGSNKLGEAMDLLGIEAPHAIGEIVAKLIEFQQTPRKVLAEKIAGWAWRLWLTVEENDYDSIAHGVQGAVPAYRTRYVSHPSLPNCADCGCSYGYHHIKCPAAEPRPVTYPGLEKGRRY